MRSEQRLVPRLREDLELIPGDPAKPGAAWLIRDIRANRFVRLGREAFLVLAHWRAGVSLQAFVLVLQEEGIDISEAQIVSLIADLSRAGLIETIASDEKSRPKPWRKFFKSALEKYLFFKIPLFYPDRFIRNTLGVFRWFATRPFFLLTLAVAFFDLFSILPQLDRLSSALAIGGNLETAAKFAVSLFIGKIFHELSHAYTAALKGCHVGSIGVGFLFGAPIFYCDVTDTWRLSDARARMLVASAGVIGEMTLAVYATALWVADLNPAINDVALYLGLATWMTTLFFNANPLVRFDGYYVLSDFLQIPNLQTRAFASVGRWFRQSFFGIENTHAGEHAALLLYGMLSLLYRLTVAFSITYILYHFTFRILGLFLFVVEFWVFIIRPLVQQFRLIWASRARVSKKRVAQISIGAAALVFAMLSGPANRTIVAPAIGTREHVTKLFNRYDGEVMRAAPVAPAVVEKESAIFITRNPLGEYDRDIARRDLQLLELRTARASITSQERDYVFRLAAETERARSHLAELEERRRLSSVVSPFGGLFLPRYELSRGNIGAGAQIGALVAGENIAFAMVPETEINLVSIGAPASFTDSYDLSSVPGKVTEIASAATERLAFPQLASSFGGPVKSHGTSIDKLTSENALYQVTIALAPKKEPFLSTRMGIAAIKVDGPGPLTKLVEAMGRLFRQESHLD